MHTLTLEQLRATIDTGGVAGVTLKALGGAFYVQVDTRNGGEAVLAKARSSEPRSFGNPAQALTLLRGLGLVVGSFDVQEWNPDDKASARTRPDRAVALKRTHEAAEHDKWFRGQVEQGLAEADDPNTAWVSHDVVKDDMQRQREALKARIAGTAK
ncbi:Prevent host death protein, Phd antitoxin [Candidatus Burkholderia pumila]|uniref:Prevent host death protein, Phd antitoxin n=1 Tax=Candidatus Burkholderia pumila TaxID=1090375 RepID=A0ABR5HPJ5_9BURK|nr:Prevent host death protein, Phd antitoxin [Candidatus Burkholderia pumila]